MVIGLGVFFYWFNQSKDSISTDSDFGMRFETLQGGMFELNYPGNYTAIQDIQTKVVKFKKIDCENSCDTLRIGGDPSYIGVEENFIDLNSKYSLKKVHNPQQPTTLLLNPKWTDKLGTIEMTIYSDSDIINEDFNKIINSLRETSEPST